MWFNFPAEAYVSFVEEEYSASEDDELVTVCLELNNVELALQEDLSVTVQTSPSTALGTYVMHRHEISGP